jgi:hypothetical protein
MLECFLRVGESINIKTTILQHFFENHSYILFVVYYEDVLESIGLDVLDTHSMLFTYFIRSSVKMWELIAPQGPFVRKERVAKSSKGVDIFSLFLIAVR